MNQVLMNESGMLTEAYRFGMEKVVDFMKDHEPLFKEHCKEVGWFKQDVPEMMWWDYLAFEKFGALRIFTLRDAASKLIGYGIYFVRKNLHYASVVVAMCDMIYVKPEFRGGTGEFFIRMIDERLKSEGVNAVTHHAKVYYDFGSMLNRLEYEHVENIYIRRLK